MPNGDDTLRIGHRDARVLVVDDEEVVARTVARWLLREGLEVEVAHSLDDALRRAETFQCDIVFSDIHMPGGSGLELARRFKAMDPTLQVVIMTGSTRLETAIEALRLHADDYLIKPFESAALLHAARRAAEHRRLLLENRAYRRDLEERRRAAATIVSAPATTTPASRPTLPRPPRRAARSGAAARTKSSSTIRSARRSTTRMASATGR